MVNVVCNGNIVGKDDCQGGGLDGGVDDGMDGCVDDGVVSGDGGGGEGGDEDGDEGGGEDGDQVDFGGFALIDGKTNGQTDISD